jgi:hypothetical protein
MAVTKILARHARLDVAINYVLNGDKTDERILTAYQLVSPDFAYQRMMRTKEKHHKTDGVQSYHIIQSFMPGEVKPQLALEIAKQFAAEYLSDFEAVIGVHQDKEHIHAHIVFNSVARVDGHKYHSSPKSYYQQIRGLSDRLCREHGLSVIMRGETSRAVSYIEWLRRTKGPAHLPMHAAGRSGCGYRRRQRPRTLLHAAWKLWAMRSSMAESGLPLAWAGKLHPARPQGGRYTEEGIQAAIAGNLEASAKRDRRGPSFHTRVSLIRPCGYQGS